MSEATKAGMDEAAAQLQTAASAKKCWTCGCLRETLAAIDTGIPENERTSALSTAVQSATSKLAEVKYDCLGCEVCYPAIAINAINSSGNLVQLDPCPTEKVIEREGWPPLPGSYRTLRYKAPVAVCTLTDDELSNQLLRNAGTDVAIVGSLQTENLGIERVIQNVVANPNIRFLILCGTDSRQAIGHLPGQSFLALSRAGLDDFSRIIGAPGKRPMIRNIPREAVEYFRRTVEVIDLVGETDVQKVTQTIATCAAQNRQPAEPYPAAQTLEAIHGYLPERMVSDPAGYFVVYADHARKLLVLEHYKNNGVLDCIIEAPKAAEVYIPAVERGLISRLDHAAYLGSELARAEESLRSGSMYVQDAAPELMSPSQPGLRACGSQMGDSKREESSCCG